MSGRFKPLFALLMTACSLRFGGPEPRPATVTMARTRVFAEGMTASLDGPYPLILDTGVVYRIEAVGDPLVVVLAATAVGPTPPVMPWISVIHPPEAPIVLLAPPLRRAPVVEGRADGIAFMVPASGEYRVWTEGTGGTVFVNVYVEATDQASRACVINRRQAGCR